MSSITIWWTSMRVDVTPLMFAGLLALSCSPGGLEPAPLDVRNDTCRWCRMTVSDRASAAQIVGRGIEPLFFDDIGCMASFLRDPKNRPHDAVAFVADHRTREWVPAAKAIYMKCPGIETAMASHLIAHVNVASQAADRDTAGCREMTIASVFGQSLPDGGSGR